MTTLSDINELRLSGFNHIDALISEGPDWNFVGRTAPFYLQYTFSISTGNEAGQGGQTAFSPAQQAATRTALAYLREVTGIWFIETNNGGAAQIHLASINIPGDDVTGLSSWNTAYTPPRSGTTVNDYSVQAYVYLDNVEFRTPNADLTPGGSGYETLLHELGHTLGLKHPFEGDIKLPYEDDHTGNTLMSYDSVGGPYSTYGQYDIAAFNWIYGGDGLGGQYGAGGRMDYLTGSNDAERISGSADSERLEGAGGDDVIDGLGGVDEASYIGARAHYDITKIEAGYVVRDRVGDEGQDVLVNIESLVFADGKVFFAYESLVQALYVGYFGRAADYNGMRSFQQQLGALHAPEDVRGLAAAYSQNAGLHALVDSFAASAESAALYPGATTTFINALYQNVFGRAPDPGGLAFWSHAIDSGSLSRANASLSIMAGALDNKTAQGVLDAKLVNNKLIVASGFTLMIDTPQEIAGYGSAAAAASVRAMLGAVTASTDLIAYQTTIGATLKSMTGPAKAMANVEYGDPIVHVDLIGIGHQPWEQTLV
ncbi:DUF4214 domain-containing protein [Massilia sp. P8910]|uniref:DUF4214 domain-containing protein n=1 Tax=Massilia antarctica TaxID=2765360 RepID=UPI001E5DF508|nr:DUF4214 domain-containing protein [Massilia antarctica]MCE3603485.1 DUF4214 domain-containing protein [Massilia antarctica]